MENSGEQSPLKLKVLPGDVKECQSSPLKRDLTQALLESPAKKQPFPTKGVEESPSKQAKRDQNLTPSKLLISPKVPVRSSPGHTLSKSAQKPTHRLLESSAKKALFLDKGIKLEKKQDAGSPSLSKEGIEIKVSV